MHKIIIETQRLLLRPLSVKDASEVYEWVSDERVARYMVYPTYHSIDKLIDWLSSIQDDENDFNFGYVRKEDGKLIGSGDIMLTKNGFWDFGYNFRYDCWGKGYATEATKGMMNYVYEHFGARKFSSSHVEQNKSSGHVMEKCGLHFVRYGTFVKLDGTCEMRSMEYEGCID